MLGPDRILTGEALISTVSPDATVLFLEEVVLFVVVLLAVVLFVVVLLVVVVLVVVLLVVVLLVVLVVLAVVLCDTTVVSAPFFSRQKEAFIQPFLPPSNAT